MTPSDCCGQCRHIRICRARCGVAHEPEAQVAPQPPASPRRRASDIALTVAAILILFVLPLAGPFLDKVRP